ncbi:MAG: DUF11 domain-containing protein [Acidobacteria bacterium]|nr:DUF11 domain-containing protein [Acidobacteriota bacterium]
MLRRIVKRFVLILTVLTLALFATGIANAQAGLTIGLAPGTDPNGEPTYTASVGNTSLANIPLLTVTYTLPVGELPISPSPSGGCLFTPGPFHLTAVCTFSNLGSNQSHDFVIAVHPVDTAPQDVTALAHAPGFDDVSAFVTSQITGVGLTEMQVTMSSTNPGKVGEALVYNVTVVNIQDDDARNVFAILALPKGTTFVSATKGCTHGVLVTCKLGQMSPGTGKTVTITVLPTVSGWAQATAGVRLTTPDRDFTNNSSANSIWINP